MVLSVDCAPCSEAAPAAAPIDLSHLYVHLAVTLLKRALLDDVIDDVIGEEDCRAFERLLELGLDSDHEIAVADYGKDVFTLLQVCSGPMMAVRAYASPGCEDASYWHHDGLTCRSV